MLSSGKEVKEFEVTATEKTPAIYEVESNCQPGDHRLAVSLLNPSMAAPRIKQRAEPCWSSGSSCAAPRTRGPTPRTTARRQARPGQGRADAREVLERFASKAYRRPVTRDELDRLVKLVEKAEAAGDKWEAAIQLAMQAVLVSPKFLFRVELDDRPDQRRAASDRRVSAGVAAVVLPLEQHARRGAVRPGRQGAS